MAPVVPEILLLIGRLLTNFFVNKKTPAKHIARQAGMLDGLNDAFLCTLF